MISKPHSILVAHHDESLRSAIRKILKGAGYHQVAIANSGRNALNRLLRDDYHLLILPLEWPDLNCWQLFRMVKSGAFCSPALPALIVCDADQILLAEPLAHEQQAGLLPSNALSQLPDAVATLIGGLSKPNVLIVEDHLETARLIELSLRINFEVDIAPSGEEGLRAWQAKHHDLVLLDLMLPTMTGSEVLKRLLHENPSQLVAVVTARSERETHQNLMLAGAAAFLSKPIDTRQLPAFCGQILHYGAYLRQRALHDHQQERVKAVSFRLQAAHFLLESGRAGMAAQHLQRAIAMKSCDPVSDDLWATLLTEFD